ncbi:MAG: PAS domain-containing protein [Candidatus Hydrogenedentes bacterium]|nr:PAS domain-containing protein [Candidatus Hydrogenedentota bacterium]
MTTVDAFNPSPVLTFDAQGIILESNPAARAAFSLEGILTLGEFLPAARDLDLGESIQQGLQIWLCAQHSDLLYRFLLQGVPSESKGYVYAQDISDLRIAHADLRAILEVTRALTQENFFHALVRNLARSCGMRYAMVGTYSEARGGHALPVAVWQDGLFVDEDEFALTGTPFRTVLEQTPSVVTIRDETLSRYPGCAIAQRLNASSFVGVTVEHGEGERIAFLGLFDPEPLREGPPKDVMLRVFAACAAGELQRRQAESRFQRVLVTFEQQLKELSCIYGLAESLRTRENIEAICEDLVQLIPPAWRYPELARARIILDGREYTSRRFVETQWGQSAAVVVDTRARGMVQVYYADDVQAAMPGGPFLASERKLLDAVARTLGEALERREIEADNRRKAIILAQERNRLETILRGIGEGVVVTDTRDRVLMMNGTAQDLLGFGAREPVDTDFLSHLKDKEFCEIWRETADAGSDFAKRDLRLGGKHPRTLSVTRSRIPELIQGEDCYVTILHDVTKEREIDQMKTDFVSGVSHELRTPMTSIKGFVTTLLRSPDMPQHLREHFLGIIHEETDRLMKLIEEVLEMGSIESGRAVLRRVPLDVTEQVSGAVSVVTAAMLAKQIIFEQDIEPGLPRFLADPTRFHTIVCNLLENAVKFTPQGGQISLRAHREDGVLVIQVQDTGIGIPKDHLDNIFERFYQVKSGTRKSAGAGLGLFLVREMVKLHGGTVTVESELERGTIFTVRLPLVIPGPETKPDA